MKPTGDEMSVTTEKSVSINIDRRNVKYEKEKIVWCKV